MSLALSQLRVRDPTKPAVIYDLTQALVPFGITYVGTGKNYLGSDGLLHLQTTNVWPLEYDSSGAVLGRSIWESRTNLGGFSDDQTNAYWVKTGCTSLKNQVGMFGGANTACSVTAILANATCLAQITRASNPVNYSVYLKRLLGTGTVNITCDGGTTWTAVTLTSSYQRFNVGQTVTNPQFGIQIVTNGDSVALSVCQLENSITPGPPIQTTTSSSVTRAIETANCKISPYATGTLFVDGYVSRNVAASSPNRYFAYLSDGTTSNIISIRLVSSKMTGMVGVAGVTQAQIIPGNTVTDTTRFKAALAWQVNNFSGVLNAGTVVSDVVGTVPTYSQLNIGAPPTGSGSANSIIRSIMIYPSKLSDALIDAITT